ncbi:hypothetical protein AMS68_000001 [Peltaster fructicola]|uniref:Uncharacterized protein n=1 Tax=Peltaster fructicola TaxID=286661 RepID=A0A6H0XIE1_9PEZI|nr:hypothetical protein AMS68_000001 [Peltaster fructicola]
MQYRCCSESTRVGLPSLQVPVQPFRACVRRSNVEQSPPIARPYRRAPPPSNVIRTTASPPMRLYTTESVQKEQERSQDTQGCVEADVAGEK